MVTPEEAVDLLDQSEGRPTVEVEIAVLRIRSGEVDDARLQPLMHTASIRAVNRAGRLSLHFRDRDGEEIVRVLEEVDALEDESDRQMMLLGLALLTLQRPGWALAIERIAEKLKGVDLLQEFAQYNADTAVPYPVTPGDQPL